MAISSYKVFLMKKGTSAFEKLVDVRDYPDLGGAPELLETTTLSNKMRTYIPGIQNADALTFTANYTKDDYETLAALAEQDNEYAVWFGGTESGGVLTPTGDAGKFTFKGDLRVYVNGGGVNEVVGMTITIAPSTDIVES